jgi:S1-C subfamily serine protease
MKNKRIITLSLICVLFLALASFCACTLEFNGNKEENSSVTDGFIPENGETVEVNILVTDPLLYAEYMQESLPEVIKRVKKGIVGITVQFANSTISGTGTVVANSEQKGQTYIATSHSLVAGASSVTVKDFSSGEEYTAVPIGTDIITDICIVRINTFIETVPFYSESQTIQTGERVFSFSNLLDSQSPVATSGIIGATDYIHDAGENNYNSLFVADLTTTYSSLGGAIFTENGGFLLGMIRQGLAVGMPALVVPSDELLEITNEIIAHGFVRGRYKLGVTVVDNKSGWGITESVSVTKLENDGCLYAEGFGLKAGDIIHSIVYAGSEYAVNKAEDFYSYLYNFQFKIGDIIYFNIERNGTNSKVGVKIVQYDYFALVITK